MVGADARHFNCGVSLNVLCGAIDGLALGILVVDRRVKVRYANRWAREILERPQGDGIEGSAPFAISPQLGSLFRPIVHRVLDSTPSLPQACAHCVTNRSTRLEVLAVPATCNSSGLVMLYLNDPAKRTRDVSELLRSLYGLTPAEAKTALLLTAEHSLAEAGAVLNVSTATVRSHIKALLRKTGTRRQAELVSRIASGLSGWIAPIPVMRYAPPMDQQAKPDGVDRTRDANAGVWCD